MRLFPIARTSEIIIQELEQELLVYDLTTNHAYQLNKTLMIVYQACDGKTSFSELQRKHKFTDDLLNFALDELQRNNLLSGARTEYFAEMSRRAAIKKVGLGTLVALPVISALAAPSAAAAASNCAATGQSCTVDLLRQGDCCRTTDRCNFSPNTCQACLGPGSKYAFLGNPTVTDCNISFGKNLCCVTRGNSGTSSDGYCTCPITL